MKKGRRMIYRLLRTVISAELCTSILVAHAGGEIELRRRTAINELFLFQKEHECVLAVYVSQFGWI